MTQEIKGLVIERRRRYSTDRPRKLSKKVYENLLAQVQKLSTENDYLKNLQDLVLEDEQRSVKTDEKARQLRTS